jgi:hypothetical protein
MKREILSLCVVTLIGMFLLTALMGSAQAEELINYSEEVGPYTISFSLPELQSGPVEFEKNISQTETLSGVVNDRYELTMYSGGFTAGILVVDHYGEAIKYDLAQHQKGQIEYFESAGFVVAPAERKIDGVDGTILRVSDVPKNADLFDIFYQKDRQTSVHGGIMLPWEQTVPLLRTINVTSSSAP